MNLFNQPSVRNHCSTSIHVICRVFPRPRLAVHSRATSDFESRDLPARSAEDHPLASRLRLPRAVFSAALDAVPHHVGSQQHRTRSQSSQPLGFNRLSRSKSRMITPDDRLGTNYFVQRCSPCPSAICCAAIFGLIVGVTSNVGGHLMPIAAITLARAIRDPEDLANAPLPSSVAPTAPFICGSA